MSIRRLFWLGAAILFSVAALVAIAAVLGGSFGTTEEDILETCGIAFVCGAATLAGLACIDRGVTTLVGWLAVVLGVATFVVWAGGVWQHDASDTYWKVAGVLGVWTLAVLVVTTLRLLVSSPQLLGTLGGIDVFAVRGDGRSVTIGSSRTQLSSSEGIVLRERT
ncbi:MAG TPA: hypothetical protein VE055_06260 [Gaiellaceae bacterium]|nr:hypothetical protein [Gaiellaceae bacterium]